MSGGERPAHHRAAGGFRNPWPTDTRGERGRAGVLRWQWERLRQTLPPNPAPGDLRVMEPRIAYPHARHGEVRISWVGHASFLIQIRGHNVLTDPHWSRRASPLRWAGPSRFVPPGVRWRDLPDIDAVLLTHDHYDHLDEPTVRRLHQRFGDRIHWLTPLGYAPWLARRGIRKVNELDWWGEQVLSAPVGSLQIVALPAQHWSSRSPFRQAERLWASWALRTEEWNVFFAGDTGYFPGFAEIAERVGPFDACLLPIGAYEPRWFMRPVHLNPEEAVQAYVDLGRKGSFVPLHWGTFRLTDEDPLEPPQRLRSAWQAAALPPERLRISAPWPVAAAHRPAPRQAAVRETTAGSHVPAPARYWVHRRETPGGRRCPA